MRADNANVSEWPKLLTGCFDDTRSFNVAHSRPEDTDRGETAGVAASEQAHARRIDNC